MTHPIIAQLTIALEDGATLSFGEQSGIIAPQGGE